MERTPMDMMESDSTLVFNYWELSDDGVEYERTGFMQRVPQSDIMAPNDAIEIGLPAGLNDKSTMKIDIVDLEIALMELGFELREVATPTQVGGADQPAPSSPDRPDRAPPR